MTRECCGQGGGNPAKRESVSPDANAGREELLIHLAGNPNTGKTTLFNLLTGARQRTGNWPGVTVERREGVYRDELGEIRIIDLPGVYSLSADTGTAGLDEEVARRAISDSDHDVIVDIVDASNLERSLYLTVQLAETRQPMVVALNMTDVAEAQGLPVDATALEERLGVPVVPMNARKGEGLSELVKAVRKAAREKTVPIVKPEWPAAVSAVIAELLPEVAPLAERRGVDAEWLVVRALEGDEVVLSELPEASRKKFEERQKKLRELLGEDIDLVLAEARYELAHELARAALPAEKAEAAHAPTMFSDRLDAIVLNRIIGPVVFLLAMYLLFMLTINVGGAFIDFFDILFGAIFVDGLRHVLEGIGAPALLIALLADGVGAGIQTVATFIPVIGFLYLGLTFLEDSGYMARAAFLADRAMRRIGLPGKAFVPLIVGFGCNVPAVMATRTLENPRDRIATMMMAPFMSCGARLAVFALFAAAFFGTGGQNIVFMLYLIGIAAAVLTGFLLKRTLLKGAPAMPFVMELPPYRLPSPVSLLLHAWIRLKGFIFGAGKIIVVVVAILGVLNSLGTDGSFGNQDSEKSVLSTIGKQITPVFSPLGIREENWPATVGLFTGVFAKEVVVGTLNALYSTMEHGDAAGKEDEAASAEEAEGFDLMGQVREALATIPENLAGLRDVLLDPLGLSAAGQSVEEVAEEQEVEAATFGAMARLFDGKVGAFAYMLFVLLYFPCAAVFGAIAREAGLRWAMFAALWSTWLGWFAAVSFYQAATFAQHPGLSAFWIGFNIIGMALVIGIIHRLGRSGALRVDGRMAPAA